MKKILSSVSLTLLLTLAFVNRSFAVTVEAAEKAIGVLDTKIKALANENDNGSIDKLITTIKKVIADNAIFANQAKTEIHDDCEVAINRTANVIDNAEYKKVGGAYKDIK